MVLKITFLPLWSPNDLDPMIMTWDKLGLIGDYCGKIQSNSDKVRQSYIVKTKWGLILQRVVVLTFRYRQHVNIADINMLSITKN